MSASFAESTAVVESAEVEKSTSANVQEPAAAGDGKSGGGKSGAGKASDGKSGGETPAATDAVTAPLAVPAASKAGRPPAGPGNTRPAADRRSRSSRRTPALLWAAVAGMVLVLVGGYMISNRHQQKPTDETGQMFPLDVAPAGAGGAPAAPVPTGSPSARPGARPPAKSLSSSAAPSASASASASASGSATPKPTKTRGKKSTPVRTSATPKPKRAALLAAGTGELIDTRGWCADNNSSRTSDGNRLQSVPCNGSAAQRWTLRTDGQIQVQGKCMTASGTGSGSRVLLYGCQGSGAQTWQSQSGGMLRNTAAGRCLDILADSDTALILRDCGSGARQQWRLP